jgi:hypothetical protein
MSRVARRNATLHGVIDELYRGALDDGAWLGALDSIHGYFGAEGLALFSIDPQTLVAYRVDVMHVARIHGRANVGQGHWAWALRRRSSGRSASFPLHVLQTPRMGESPWFTRFGDWTRPLTSHRA